MYCFRHSFECIERCLRGVWGWILLRLTPHVPLLGPSWSCWLVRSPWAPRCGGECGDIGGMGRSPLWVGLRPQHSLFFPTGPSGTEGLQGVPGEWHCPLGLHVPAPLPLPASFLCLFFTHPAVQHLLWHSWDLRCCVL